MRKHCTDECKKVTAEEQVPLLNKPLPNKPPPRKSFFSVHGTHDPEGIISEEHAARPIATFKELTEMRKEAAGDATKKHGLAFEVSCHPLPCLPNG